MRRLWQKKIAVLIALLFLAAGVMPPLTAQAFTGSLRQDGTAGMEQVAKTQESTLYLDKANAMLRLVDNKTGVAVETKVLNGDSGNANMKANQKSDFIIAYYKNDRSAGTTTQENYTMAISKGQVEYESIENGVRANFTLKEDKISFDCVPKYISQERMETLVLNHLDSEERKWMNDYYRLYNGYYTRSKNGTEALQSVIRRVYEDFYEVGIYTEADLIADNEEYGYESEWNNLEFNASVEYVLDGGDLLVRFPMERLTVNDEDIIISDIVLLPYFLSATQEEQGYMVIPDGSGALINYNNGLIYASDYSNRVYGKDVLIDVQNMGSAEYKISMPIIGMVYQDYAMLAIVENGQSMAEINARISGKVDNYNIAYFRFYVTEKENVATTVNSSVQVNRFTGDTLKGDIVVRYKLFTDAADLNYSGLAHAYQEYLINQGILTSGATQGASLYLELLGSTLEAKTMLGFPYRGTIGLTTFKEAAAIMEDLSSRGVSNASVQLDGWLEGGQRHTKLTKVKLEGQQGGKSDFAKLVKTAQDLGYGLYPDVAFQEINQSYKMFQGNSAASYAKKYGSRYLSNQYAAITEKPQAGFDILVEMIWSPYAVSPTYLADYAQKAVKGLNKLDITGLTVSDLGTRLVADYNEKAPVSRETAMTKVGEVMDTLNASYEVIAKNPYQYAWKGVTMMSDLPSRSNEYTVFNQDIPFIQLVLDGCVSYSTEPLNNQPQKNMSELLLQCIETRSNPKFYLMDADMDQLQYALYADYMSINYGVWADKAVQLFQEYEVFAQKVSGSKIASHEILADNVKKVTYDNGVIVYLNYNDGEVTVDGKQLAAESYLLVQ